MTPESKVKSDIKISEVWTKSSLVFIDYGFRIVDYCHGNSEDIFDFL